MGFVIIATLQCKSAFRKKLQLLLLINLNLNINYIPTIMQNLLYSIAILLLIFWALGFFIYNTGATIHLLLLAAVGVVLLKIIKGEKV